MLLSTLELSGGWRISVRVEGILHPVGPYRIRLSTWSIDGGPSCLVYGKLMVGGVRTLRDPSSLHAKARMKKHVHVGRDMDAGSHVINDHMLRVNSLASVPAADSLKQLAFPASSPH